MHGSAATASDLLAEARAGGVDRLDAQLLIAHHSARSRSWVIAHDREPLPAPTVQRLRADFAQRARGMPLAYLTGEREFHRLRLCVTPDVLVPRPDTETLVDWAIELLDGPLAARQQPAVVDLGTGSGAIGLAVKVARRRATVLATDASVKAIEVARANADALKLDVAFGVGDWWAATGAARFDLALANPPYVAVGDAHLAALVHEPIQALEAGVDGLDAIRTIVTTAASHLHDDGWLLLEHADDQQPAVAALLATHGFADVSLRRDLAGLRRCSGGRHRG